ncbi:MAG: type VI secretion system baseplate subunit TssF [Gammaproteobacteria bacterium]|nr:type VI secretion system baseplate subunit TssF [Gammaproteobacteria bacterium]
MSSAGAGKPGSLKYYFEQELRHLRDEAATFAHDYPAIAQELALSRGKCADPHVELLLQSFAFLVGRLQHEQDAEQATIPNALLQQLYPHLTAPLPSMAIAQVDVKSDGANFANGWTLARERTAFAMASNDSGRRVSCRMRNCYDTPLWPLTVRDAGLVPTNQYDFLTGARDVFSVLRVRIGAMSTEPIQDLPIKSLRFYLHGDDHEAYRLYDLLAAHLVGMAVLVPNDPTPRRLPAEALHWLGFGDDEAMLPIKTETPPAYRLLQEYFAFPEKFLFFEAQGLDCRGATTEFDLLFLLDVADKSVRVPAGALRLNCVPLVNLYAQPLEPLRLDQRQYEYRLIADQTAHSYCEIYQLDQVVALKPDASPRPVAPYFAMESYAKIDRHDYFYATRRVESQMKSVPGTELYIAFLDSNLDVAVPPQETIGGRALCTNRRLPEKLRAGERLHLEGPGPVNAIRLLNKPTSHQTPSLLNAQPWALVSQLSVNHLSLTGRADSLDVLKSMLRLHTGRSNGKSAKQIDSLLAIRSQPVVRHIGDQHWRGFCRGIGIHLLFDEERFAGGSLLLFGEVLRRFFALYANLNTFAQLTLESQQRKGEIKTWPPLAGDQIVL